MILVYPYINLRPFNLNYNHIFLVDNPQKRKSYQFTMVDHRLLTENITNCVKYQLKIIIILALLNTIIHGLLKVKALPNNLKALDSKGSGEAKTETTMQLIVKCYNIIGQNGGIRNEQ